MCSKQTKIGGFLINKQYGGVDDFSANDIKRVVANLTTAVNVDEVDTSEVSVGIDEKNEAVNELKNFKFETVSLGDVNKSYGLDENNKARGDIACSQSK